MHLNINHNKRRKRDVWIMYISCVVCPADVMEMLMLQNAQMHQLVMQQLMLSNRQQQQQQQQPVTTQSSAAAIHRPPAEMRRLIAVSYFSIISRSCQPSCQLQHSLNLFVVVYKQLSHAVMLLKKEKDIVNSVQHAKNKVSIV